MSGVTVELTGVTKTYGQQTAVHDVALALHEGECVALAGHNGAGKSTLIKLMLGLINPCAGRVSVLGQDPGSHAATACRFSLGYLPENVALHPAMTGQETLAFYARLKRQPITQVSELLQKVGIAKAAKRRVGTYSKGMRQRLGLAQALLGEPKVLLLDEPTSGLDPASRQSFYHLIGELRGRGTTILLSSHALAEMESQVDRIIIMNQGSKVADGTMADLRRNAALPVRIKIRLSATASSPRAVASDGSAAWSEIGPLQFQRLCASQEKAGVIRELGAQGVDYEDIEIDQPGLDDMYAHFLRRADI